jgi:hypothetical protein
MSLDGNTVYMQIENLDDLNNCVAHGFFIEAILVLK